jgi:hypothetical protein
MTLAQWSTVAANNATADPSINWQEGQAPSTVNDSARAMMAAIATWYQAPEWLNLGDTPTYASATQFTVPTNRTSAYTVGRRMRAKVTAGTIYGTITESAFASVTTVTVQWDAGSLDGGLSEVDVGISNPAYPSITNLGALTVSSLQADSQIVLAQLASPNIAPIKFGDGSGWKLNFETLNGSSVFATLQDSGNFAISGTFTGADIAINGGAVSTPATISTTTGSAYQKFSGSGGAKYVGVGANDFIVLNSSGNTVLLQLDDSGNETIPGTMTAGNLTATSDERYKRDWKPVSGDFVDQLAGLLSGTYEDVASGERRVGVGAQSLQRFLPEAVVEVNEQLTVAYGHAALVACVELAKEVRRLRALLEPVK